MNLQRCINGKETIVCVEQPITCWQQITTKRKPPESATWDSFNVNFSSYQSMKHHCWENRKTLFSQLQNIALHGVVSGCQTIRMINFLLTSCVIRHQVFRLTIPPQKLHFFNWKQIKCVAITVKISDSFTKHNSLSMRRQSRITNITMKPPLCEKLIFK